MLDREEERRLAEIEARLRVEDPELHELFAKAPAARPSRPGRPERPDRPERNEQNERAEPSHDDLGPTVEPDLTPFDQGAFDEQAPRRHPSDAPRRRWDDGPVFDAVARKALSPLGAVVRSLSAIMVAIALTTVVTLALGPDIGGFVAVVAFCLAGMYGYQTLRGCPGMRRARGQG